MKNQRLNEIQEKLDENFTEYVKSEFNLHLHNFEQIKPLLQERDLAILENKKFWGKAFMKSEFGSYENQINLDIIKTLYAGYEQDYWCVVEIGLYENKYTDKTILKKRFNVATEEVEFLPFDYKEETENELLGFFKDEEVDLDVFDSLYNLYVNGVHFYSLRD